MNQIPPKSSNIGVSMVSMAAGTADNELREWLRLLNRRKTMIIGVGLVVVALTALILAPALATLPRFGACHARYP